MDGVRLNTLGLIFTFLRLAEQDQEARYVNIRLKCVT